MGAVPKRKISKARRDRRRSHHALKEPKLEPCKSCGTMKKPHYVCPNCGKYDEKEVMEVE